MSDHDDDLPTVIIETHGGGGAGTFLLGALVGAAAALLLAPRSGPETQAEIAGAVRRLRDDVEGRVTGARDRVADAVDSVRESVGTRVSHARAAVEAGVDAARDAREQLQRRVDDAKRAYRDTLGRNGDAPAAEGSTAVTVSAGKVGDVVVVDVSTESSTGDLA